MKMEIRPVTIKYANNFVKDVHRHNGPAVGSKFCIGVFEGKMCHGVAICGRPVSRRLDDGLVLEISRVCTDGKKNACSMLYGASVRVAREMGYHKVVTYTLVTENGASLKASNFKNEGIAGGLKWNGRVNDLSNTLFPDEVRSKCLVKKNRWTYVLKLDNTLTI